MRDLIRFWLDHCQSSRAYSLLEEHGYIHNSYMHGDIGGLNARMSGRFFELDENGEFMIAQAVWRDTPSPSNPVGDPILYDIIAFHPGRPNKWYFLRGEPGLILGEKAHHRASLFDEPLIIHSNPFSWLTSGCVGSVLLDHHGLNQLYGLHEIICENVEHGTRIETGLSIYYKTNMPRFSVPALTENRV